MGGSRTWFKGMLATVQKYLESKLFSHKINLLRAAINLEGLIVIIGKWPTYLSGFTFQYAQVHS